MKVFLRSLRAIACRDLFGASAILLLLSLFGVFAYAAGALYPPLLGLSKIQMMFALILLAIFAVLCTAVGLLAVVIERLGLRAGGREDD